MSIQRPTLGRIWSSEGNRLDPGAEKYALGWTAEIPTYEVLNFLQHKTDCTLLATAQRGVPEWGSDVTYEKGAVAWDNLNSTIYCAMVPAPNNSIPPSQNPSQWEISSLQFTASTHVALSKKIDDHIADVQNPHKVTTEQVGTYNKPTIDTKIAKVSTDTSNHANDKTNPHKVTAAQAGGVPITGGRYTGPVGFNSNEVKINAQAGDHSVLAETDRLSLRNKTAKLSIHADGSATANGVKLINEQQYPAVRAKDEHLYAVPVPDLYLDLLNDIHIKQGTGFSELIRNSSQSYVDKTGATVTAAAGMPRHTAKGLLLDALLGEILEVDTKGNFNPNGNFTVSVGFQFDSPINAMLLGALEGPNFFRMYVYESKVRAYFQGVGGAAIYTEFSPAIQTGNAYVFTMRKSGLKWTGFLNGVEAIKEATLTEMASLNAAKIVLSPTVGSYKGNPYYTSLRIWNHALTAEQISTL